jgi:DNA-damage-inducible protein D
MSELSKSGIEIRRIWHKGEWFYSITDVIAVLTDSNRPNVYWSNLKARAVKTEGFEEVLRNVEQVKLKSQDNRLRFTDVANRQTLLRIIQSVPTPKAEPFKLWLAEVGEQRFDEIENPELALDRMRQIYKDKGYADDWIEQRIRNDLIRNELTDEWKERGAKEGIQYAILTNEIHEGSFELSVQAHKEYKLLPAKTNLRDHMTGMELALLSLGEATATVFHRERDSQGYEALKKDAKEAGTATGEARKVIEKAVGHSVVSNQNYLPQQKKAKEQLKQGPQMSLFDMDAETKPDE